jgi:hypothetical protein
MGKVAKTNKNVNKLKESCLTLNDSFEIKEDNLRNSEVLPKIEIERNENYPMDSNSFCNIISPKNNDIISESENQLIKEIVNSNLVLNY